MKNRLREARISRGLTLTEAAQVTGFSQSYISEMERGLKSISLERMSRIARAYNVDVKELIDEHHPPIQLVGRVGATERGLPFIDTTGYQAPAEKEYAPHFQGAKYIDEEHCTVAALVEGASMGEWLNGCYVYYNKPLITSVPEEWLGRVCVVLGADGEMYLKTILRGKNGLFNLKSGNGELIQDVKVEAVSLVLGYVQPQNKKT